MQLKHILSAEQFTDPAYLDRLFAAAALLEKQDKEKVLSPVLSGKILACIFYEPSTRTRLSFEIAAKKLGGQVITAESGKYSLSAVKGESLEDTIKIISGYVNAIVLRHPEEGSAERAAKVSIVPIINAGDGGNQHPTQALLDLYTIKKLRHSLENLTIAFGCDPLHSRTIRSLATVLSHYPQNKFIFISPPSLRAAPAFLKVLRDRGVEIQESEILADGLEAEILYLNRLQQERFASAEEFEQNRKKLILKSEMLRGKKVLVMDPLPRIDEIDVSVDVLPNAVYFRQAKNGLYLRMALLQEILGTAQPRLSR